MMATCLVNVVSSEGLEEGYPCVLDSMCDSTCCSMNIKIDTTPFFTDGQDLFKVNTPSYKFDSEEKDDIETKENSIKSVGTKKVIDGVDTYTYSPQKVKDAPEWALKYVPAFSEELDGSNTFTINYVTSVCQSNVTMCDGSNDFNWDDADAEALANAAAGAVAAGASLLLLFILAPIIACICICICCCYCQKSCCFAKSEDEVV